MSEMNDFNVADVEDLFPSDSPEEVVDTNEITEEKEEEKDKNTPQPLLDNASLEDLFPDENKKEKEEKTTKEIEIEDKDNDDGELNRYSELSKILYEEGVFDNLDEEDLEEVKDADDFKALIQEQINRGLNERQQEISDALTYGVEPSVIQTYANAMGALNRIEPLITEESEEGKKARVNAIYQDYINRGIKDAKARSLVQASLTAGTDIEDAKEAVASLKEYYSDAYKQAVAEAKEEEENRQNYIREQDNLLKKNLLEKKDLFGGIDIDKRTRQKAYDAVAKASAKDDKGNPLTAIQKYAQENPVDFRAMLGIVYSVTDGFTNLTKLFNKAVDKKVHSKLDELTRKLTSSNSQKGEGGVHYKNGPAEDLLDTNRWRVFL